MSSIAQKEAEVVEEFELFDDWTEKYAHLIDMAKTLPMIDENYKREEFLIKGCQSKVWLRSELIEEKIHFTADSEAVITKGIVALLVRILSEQKPEDIVNAKLDFIDQIGLKEQLSPTRANGLNEMIKRMKLFASLHQNAHSN